MYKTPPRSQRTVCMSQPFQRCATSSNESWVCLSTGVCPAAPAPNNLLKQINLRRDKLVFQAKGGDGGLYHEGCRGDIREQVDRHPSADEDSCRQAGKVLAVAPAGGVGPGIVANHYPSLFKAPKTLLQVATETLSGKTNRWSERKWTCCRGQATETTAPPPTLLLWDAAGSDSRM